MTRTFEAPAVAGRPIVHLTPPTAWLNDPNGLIFLDGEYHAFYQHNPSADVWGPMHWGHAVSTDLVSWQHLPIALVPDEHGTIYSGSCVVDTHDVAGFGPGALLAFFTHHNESGQRQSLAYSTDAGRTWTKWSGNPILVDTAAGPDFRDPRVLHNDRASGPPWVMVVAAGEELRFYGSDDLLRWSLLSTLHAGHEDLGALETPDLFRVPVDGGPGSRWVLSVGHLSGGPAGGSGVRYFVGDFDGTRFVPDEPVDRVRWADHGADLYAAQTWANEPDERPIWIGWVNNWRYADRIPSTGWRGAMSVPRQLGLVTADGPLMLAQQPVDELRQVTSPLLTLQDVDLSVATEAVAGIEGQHLDLAVVVDLDRAKEPGTLGLHVGVGPDERTIISYEPAAGVLALDRRGSGAIDFDPAFPAVHSVALDPAERLLSLRVILDGSCLEVFAQGGIATVTDLVFPSPGSCGVEILGPSDAHVVSLEVRRIDPR